MILNDWWVEFAHIKLQRPQNMIRSIIAFETAHAQNGIWRKVPRPLPGQPGLSLRPWSKSAVPYDDKLPARWGYTCKYINCNAIGHSQQPANSRLI